ncbi:creatininase family protein [Gryllotalpicola ginsengisoli]|uniref:creatininase family protein n=1 Tax=Gryllotalpicola ginsengisoli TaxID=444608 RepID=UPI0003B30EBB|nr:creatininase family protein [Gryllotalpicola ginsengisoli]
MSAFDEVRAEFLSLKELDARVAAQPIAYLPLGTLEFHGPHLPIGLDALTAHTVCISAAEQGGGIVLPPVFQGFGGGHGHYPWTIMMADGTGIEAHLRATLTRLEDFGISTAVVFSGHFAPEQLDMIDELESSWNASDSALRVLATAVNRYPASPLPPDHAGEFETTLLAGSSPGLIHLDRLPDLSSHPANDPDGDAYGPHRHEPGHPLWGVFGPDPRSADLSTGPYVLAQFGAWLSMEAAAAGR